MALSLNLTMAYQKISVSLDPELIDFLDQQDKNRSQVIAELLWEKKKTLYLQELGEAYAAQASDTEFQDESEAWDVTVGDGLNAEAEEALV